MTGVRLLSSEASRNLAILLDEDVQADRSAKKNNLTHLLTVFLQENTTVAGDGESWLSNVGQNISELFRAFF